MDELNGTQCKEWEKKTRKKKMHLHMYSLLDTEVIWEDPAHVRLWYTVEFPLTAGAAGLVLISISRNMTYCCNQLKQIPGRTEPFAPYKLGQSSGVASRSKFEQHTLVFCAACNKGHSLCSTGRRGSLLKYAAWIYHKGHLATRIRVLKLQIYGSMLNYWHRALLWPAISVFQSSQDFLSIDYAFLSLLLL